MISDVTSAAEAAGPQVIDQRPVRPLPGLTINGWRLKVYGMAYGREEPRSDLVAAARAAAGRALPQPARGEGRDGVGFVIIHDGALGRWALYFWWSERILLRQRLFRSPTNRPLDLQPAKDDGLIACLYELHVVNLERESWLRNVLAGPNDIEAYLADQIPAQPAIGWPSASHSSPSLRTPRTSA
jgi:hypothetical protein